MKEVSEMSVFSDELSKLMRNRDMSDEDLASVVNVNRTTVSRWRSGERSPKIEKLPEIASVFNVDPKIFVGENNESITSTSFIETIYNKLSENRQEKVAEFAINQLEEQKQENSPTPLRKESSEKEIYTLAAHASDSNLRFTDEEVAELESYLDELDKEYDKKQAKRDKCRKQSD